MAGKETMLDKLSGCGGCLMKGFTVVGVSVVAMVIAGLILNAVNGEKKPQVIAGANALS